jgi:hypothetical protein
LGRADLDRAAFGDFGQIFVGSTRCDQTCAPVRGITVIVEVPVSSEANTSTRLLFAAIPMLRAVLP